MPKKQRTTKPLQNGDFDSTIEEQNENANILILENLSSFYDLSSAQNLQKFQLLLYEFGNQNLLSNSGFGKVFDAYLAFLKLKNK